ncbi:zinc-dependent metalloprotease [Candidatus Palauibacter sp.]|uniref:zinc-dependent metalloprotease n=1 Tax=Candidatus Palauibacter sp. TaxID=3101350 RepID=UPI003C6F412D
MYSVTRFRLRLVTLLLFLVPASTAAQDSGGELPSIEEKTASMREIDGFVPMYWEASSGKLWLEISRWDTDMLHMTGLASGLGSNDIGLDRGALAGSRLVRFHRVGPKVLLTQPNLGFRASSTDAREVQAVTDAFAPSTLWGFTAAAETDGRVLVDATDFVVRDMINWAQRLRPGTYRFDASRSAVHLPMTMGFPENTEIEASLTFVRQPGGAGGGFGGFGGGGGGGGGAFEGVGNVASTGEAATIRLHHSFVQLPELGEYTPRAFDPRAGFGAMSYADYSAPLGEDMRQRFIRRHRLEKRDPSAAMSEPVEPIVYYLDPGAPEPIRTALLEGGRWWNQAFEAAGFRDGFQVEMLPEGVSSHDVRYNVINWVHRSTRGWSTGGSVTDPRTGEILKGVVTLGSLRWRQDYLIAEGLLSPYANGDEAPEDIAAWALARIRQLSAHEVGHTLGLGHNYYDSEGGRISVMDYPHPLVTLGDDGRLDYSEVYDVDIGEWDKVAITYGYSDFPSGTDEAAELRRILDEAWDEDIIYFTNQDIGVHARADQWSNGVDAAAELDRMMEVRRHALDRFGEAAIRAGRPIVTVEEALVPLYMHHRYQVDAAASMLGGLEYIYAVRGDGRTPMRRVSGDAQRAALAALAATLRSAELAIPAGVLDLLPPRPPGFGRSRETFPRYTGPAFDAVTPAVVAADHTVSQVLEPARAARLVQQHALDPQLPGLGETLTTLVDAVRPAANETLYHTELRLAAYRVLVDRIMALADRAPMPHVRALATRKLVDLRAEMAANPPPERDAAFVQLVDRDIERFLDKPAAPYEMPGTPAAPPGAPIGEPAMDWLAGEAWTAAGPAGWATRWLGISPVCEADRGGF